VYCLETFLRPKATKDVLFKAKSACRWKWLCSAAIRHEGGFEDQQGMYMSVSSNKQWRKLAGCGKIASPRNLRSSSGGNSFNFISPTSHPIRLSQSHLQDERPIRTRTEPNRRHLLCQVRSKIQHAPPRLVMGPLSLPLRYAG